MSSASYFSFFRRICRVSWCNDRVMRYHKYCRTHILYDNCIIDGCKNIKINNDDRVIIRDCDLCIVHKCHISKCKNIKCSDSDVCIDHCCKFGQCKSTCRNNRIDFCDNYTKFCEVHTCHVDKCNNKVIDNDHHMCHKHNSQFLISEEFL